MTLSLNYNDDLSRVQISITDLPFSEGTVRIERSTNQLYWQTVRGATALPVVGGAAAVDDYEFTADIENHYRVVPTDEGLHLPGDTTSYASTPNHADLQITGDIVLTAVARLNTWVGASGTQMLVSRYDAASSDRSYQLSVQTNGTVRISSSPDGTTAINMTSTVPVPASPGQVLAVRAWLDVDLNDAGTTRRALFYISPTGEDGTWTQLGSAVDASGATSIHAGSSELRVGVAPDGAGPARGVVYRAHVWAGGLSGGELAAGSTRADPVFSGLPMGSAGFTDSVGRVWTVHGGAGIAGVEEDSITPSLDGKAWLKSIKHPFLNRPLHRVLAGGGQSISRAARGSVFDVQGRSVPVAVTDIRSSREFTLTVQVPDEAAARDMDLTLASGDVFFLQIPPELAPHMTGGYVRIGESTQHREADTIMWRFTIPCTVVAPPGPGVVGTTMTWGGVFRLYGSWDALVASNPTWGDLLATVGSPDDLVVL